MKIRWTCNSLRMRITPGELQTLQAGRPVIEELAIPGGDAWRAEIRPQSAESTLKMEQGSLHFFLSRADLEKLSAPGAEGVYLRWKDRPEFLYFIEKDFPCAHPRVGDASEPATDTFQPTKDFAARKSAP